MPLIDITGNVIYFPPNAPVLLTPTQLAVIDFGRRLAEEVHKNRDELHLEEDTPFDAVQVDFKRYSDHAINPVELWTQVKLTEIIDVEQERFEIRDLLIGITEELYLELPYLRDVPFKWALDAFIGPYAHGCISDDKGVVAYRW